MRGVVRGVLGCLLPIFFLLVYGAPNCKSEDEAEAPASLQFGTAPSASAVVNQTWPMFSVRVADGRGTTAADATDAITISLASGGGTLGGTLTQNAVNGVATFSDITYDVLETIEIDITAVGLAPIVGRSVNITQPTAQIAFANAPANTEFQNVTFSYISVRLEDAAGNLVTTDTTTQVTLSLSSGGGTLSGTFVRTAERGVVVFDDVSYDTGEQMTLQATSTPPLNTLTSGPIEVFGNPSNDLPTTRVSVATGGAGTDLGSGDAQLDTAYTTPQALAADGRFAAFSSWATNLGLDTTLGQGVFLRDLSGRETIPASGSSGVAPPNGSSARPAISADGRYVAYRSSANNLAADDANFGSDIFFYDRLAGTIGVASRPTDGDATVTGANDRPSISASGRRIAFESTARLVSDDTNADTDIYVRDLATGETLRANVPAVGDYNPGGVSSPALSADGNVVAFVSQAFSYVGTDTNALADVYVRDLAAGTTTIASRPDGSLSGQSNGKSAAPTVSGNGRLVAFASEASNLVASDANASSDIFLRDTLAGTTVLISVDSLGRQADGASHRPSISADGRWIAFQSDAANLVPDDTNGVTDIFVRDVGTSATYRVSLGADGDELADAAWAPAISADGRYVTFTSGDGTVVAGDTNGVRDVFTAPVIPLSRPIPLLSGRSDLTQSITSSETFSPDSLAWTGVTEPPPGLLCWHAVAALGDGRLLLAGGNKNSANCGSISTTTDETYLYDPNSNTWTPTNPMVFDRNQFTLVTLLDGRVMALGGCTAGCTGPSEHGDPYATVAQSAEIFDPQTETWAQVAGMSKRRSNTPAAAALADGRVMVCGGTDGFSTVYSDCETYDPATDSWSPAGTLPAQMAYTYGGIIGLPSGGAVAVPSYSGQPAVYDPALNQWSPTATLSPTRAGAQLALLPDGRVFISGGNSGTGVLDTTVIYDPVADRFDPGPTMLEARTTHGAISLPSGRVLLAGGCSAASPGCTALGTTAEIVDPIAGTSTMVGNVVTPRQSANYALGLPTRPPEPTPAPLDGDANTTIIDHFDGSTGASILAYTENGAPCGAAKPAATPASQFDPGLITLSDALTLHPPVGEPAGSATYLRYPQSWPLGMGTGTLEMWVYLTTWGVGLIDHGPYFGSCAGWTFGMGVDGAGVLNAGAWAAFNLNSGTTTVPLNEWVHVAVTWGGSGAKLYINGAQVGSDPTTSGPSAGFGAVLLVRLGAPTGDSGRIDELRVSNIQRTTFPVP